MADQHPDELASLRAELVSQRTEIDRLKRRRRLPRRALPLLLGVALVALIPLATLAAAPIFSDLGDAAAVHQPDIVAIGNVGVATGFDDPNSGNTAVRLYNPKRPVTREEMASFLARLGGLGDHPPVANAATAQTVPDGSITPAKLSPAGSTAGQVLTSTGTGVAFQALPVTGGVEDAIVRQSAPTPLVGTVSAIVSCEPTELATGGGYTAPFTGAPVFISEDRPIIEAVTNRSSGWIVSASAFSGTPTTLTAFAVCVPVP